MLVTVTSINDSKTVIVLTHTNIIKCSKLWTCWTTSHTTNCTASWHFKMS